MIINPDLESAKEVARILYLPATLEVNSFAHGQAEMIKFKIPEGNILANLPIAQLSKATSHKVLICAVERDGEVYIPSGNFVLEEGDIISYVANRKVAKQFLNDLGFNTRQLKNTMIIGGGTSAQYLADKLLHSGVAVKIIERDRARCEELSLLLPKAIIINGDGTDEELLKEEGIQSIESFVPLTGIDEENMVISMYAKKKG